MINLRWAELFLFLALCIIPWECATSQESESPLAPTTPTAPAPEPVAPPPLPEKPAEGANAPAATGETGAAPETQPSISVPGTYGTGSVVLTPGEGRFAQSHFKFTLALNQGYDDNIYGIPFDLPEPLPNEPAPSGIIGSAVTQLTAEMQTQALNTRTAYITSLSIGGIYYWDTPGKQIAYNGSLKLVYFHKISPRLDVSAVVDLSYLNQPNFNYLNTSSSGNTGQYIAGTMKLDITRQWTSRIQTDTSYNLNTTLYQDEASKGSNVFENTLGTQFRYLLSPKAALTMDVRAAMLTHPNNETANTSSFFLLGGFDLSLSPRLHSTLSLGEQMQNYKSSGDTASTPYLESSLAYKYGKGSTLSWTSRVGFEDSGSSTEKEQTFRTGLTINQVITGKISGSLAANYIYKKISAIGNNISEQVNENDLSLSLGLQYVVTRTLTLSLSINRFSVNSNLLFSDYNRDQFFLGGVYSF